MVAIASPKQRRSRQTYEALLACAESLLTNKSFQEVSLTELCQGANCSTGAFYHRFANKDALLLHLEERVYDSAHQLLEEVFRDADQLTGRELLRALVAGVVDFYVARQGSIRALSLAAQSDPELQQRLSSRGREVMERGSAFLQRRTGLGSRDADRSIDFALVTLRAVLREVILFGSADFREFSRDALVSELTEQFIRYLGLRGEEW